MTNEEAIKVLERERGLLREEGDPVEFPSAIEVAEALNLAIDALRKRIAGLQLLKSEEERKCPRPDRIAGLYDGLGIDFFN